MISVDTNLLIYAFARNSSQHAAAQKALNHLMRSGETWIIALPVIGEFWNVVTNPTVFTINVSPAAVRDFFGKLTTVGGAVIAYPRTGFAERLLQTAEQLDARRGRIFDLQIALISQENGATELWSHDAAFLAPSGLLLRDPIKHPLP